MLYHMENKYGKRYFTKKRTKEALILYISEKIFEEKFLKEAKTLYSQN